MMMLAFTVALVGGVIAHRLWLILQKLDAIHETLKSAQQEAKSV